MTLLTCQRIERSFGELQVLDGASLRIDEKDRIGIVGDNGAGKTTLLRILAGTDEPDRGERIPRRGLRVAYAAQIPEFAPGRTLLEIVHDGDGSFPALAERVRALEARLAEQPDDAAAITDYGEAQAAFEAGGGWHRRNLCERVLGGVGFAPADFDKPARVLSGGEKSRLALAALMTSPADLLLLDEPTNHLDLPGIQFLEEFVQGYPGAVVVVSHDRTFLDAVVRIVAEVDDGKVTTFRGNWSAWQQQKDHALLAAARAYKSQQEFVQKEIDYIRRNMAGRMTRQAQGRLKRLQRLELITRPRESRARMRLRFGGGRGLGGQSVLSAEGLTATLPDGRVLLQRAELRVFHGETIGIVGPNGAGKSTLLRMLAGELAPAAGQIERAHGMRIGFFRQEMQDLPRTGSVIDALRALDVTVPEKELRDHLALFLFCGDDVERPVEGLSGGEQRRLALARLTRAEHDLLLLDEPTNHLDIAAREGLEEALLGFSGTCLAVSHDRAFLARVTDRIWHVGGGALRSFPDLERCLATLAAERRQRASESKPSSAQERDDAGRPGEAGRIRNPYQFAKLEERIFNLEEELGTLRAAMTAPENYQDARRMQDLIARERTLQDELAVCYERWENWA